MPINEYIRNRLKVLPSNPGVYKFVDNKDRIIYVGKAKNLKKRVSSYFKKNHESFKTKLLVKKIVKIEHIVVDTESDALLLENNLIKEYQPRYNVLLKDDKTFPWICISNEPFPRLYYTRNIVKDGSEYYGPYTSIYMVKTVINLIRQIYHIRTCRLKLTPENITSQKFDVCLEYHIGNCLGACVGKQQASDYLKDVEQARNIIKGNLGLALSFLKQQMKEFSDDLKFEEAEKIKEKITIVENYKLKSTVVSPTVHNVDVFALVQDNHSAYVNYLKVINGAVVHAHTLELRKRLDEENKDLLISAITEMRQRTDSNSKEIIVAEKPDYNIEGTYYVVPQKGDKMKLLDLSQRNAKFYMLEKHKQIEVNNPEKATNRKLATLKKDLRMSELPVHIECFDNSNIQGSSPVAACVVFKNLKPSKKDYRHYHIKTVVGADDFASMAEVVYRRYKRLIEDEKDLPQLIIVDGGKGQLSSALSSLKRLKLDNKINIIGIAKRLEEIYFPNDSVPIYIDKNSESLRIIRHARDEAHRFGITFHRNTRSKNFVISELEEIHGIGNKTVQILLVKFGSVKAVKKASKKQIEDLIGKSKSDKIFKQWQKK